MDITAQLFLVQRIGRVERKFRVKGAVFIVRSVVRIQPDIVGELSVRDVHGFGGAE